MKKRFWMLGLIGLLFLTGLMVVVAEFNPNTERTGLNLSAYDVANLTDQQLINSLATTWTYNASDVTIDENTIYFPYRHLTLQELNKDDGEPYYSVVSEPKITTLSVEVTNYCIRTYGEATCRTALVQGQNAFNLTIGNTTHRVEPLVHQWTVQMLGEYVTLQQYRANAQAWIAQEQTRTRINTWLRSIGGVDVS